VAQNTHFDLASIHETGNVKWRRFFCAIIMNNNSSSLLSNLLNNSVFLTEEQSILSQSISATAPTSHNENFDQRQLLPINEQLIRPPEVLEQQTKKLLQKTTSKTTSQAPTTPHLAKFKQVIDTIEYKKISEPMMIIEDTNYVDYLSHERDLQLQKLISEVKHDIDEAVQEKFRANFHANYDLFRAKVIEALRYGKNATANEHSVKSSFGPVERSASGVGGA
jgi:hypothetical protein